MQVRLSGFQCRRCGHQWRPRKEGIPVKCPSCKSPYWSRPRRGEAPQAQGSPGEEKTQAPLNKSREWYGPVKQTNRREDEGQEQRQPVSQSSLSPGLFTHQLDPRSQVERLEDADDIDDFLASTQRRSHRRSAESSAALFADAESLLALALEDLDAGRLRNAAEKAWGATFRATAALVMSRNNSEPRTTSQTRTRIREVARVDPAVTPISERYSYASDVLHGGCFYDGSCEPEESIADDIRSTADFIREARRLANPSL